MPPWPPLHPHGLLPPPTVSIHCECDHDPANHNCCISSIKANSDWEEDASAATHFKTATAVCLTSREGNYHGHIISQALFESFLLVMMTPSLLMLQMLSYWKTLMISLIIMFIVQLHCLSYFKSSQLDASTTFPHKIDTQKPDHEALVQSYFNTVC